MKRIISVIMVIVVMLCMAGCEKSKAEKYCSSCGEGISANVSYCGYCGAKIHIVESGNSTSSGVDDGSSSEAPTVTSKPTGSSKPTTSSKPTESSKPTTSKPTDQNQTDPSQPSPPIHTHVYNKKVTPATCKEVGYTTYTCACGDSYVDDYTSLGSHSYYKYVCSKCGVVDKSHAYEYLVEWVKTNGTVSGDSIEYIYESTSTYSDVYGLTYSIEGDYLYIWHFEAVLDDVTAFTSLSLDDYYYGYSFYGDRIYGYLNARTYSNTTELTYRTEYCSRYDVDDLLPTAKKSMDVVLSSFKVFLLRHSLNITISDLGFKSY